MVVSAEHEADVILQVREFLRGEEKLKCPTTDEFLTRFARASNYNVKNTLQLIKDYYKAKVELPNEFVCELASSYEDIISRTELGFILPQDDKLGRIALFLRLGNVDPTMENWNRCIQLVVLLLEWLSRKYRVQEYGACLIVDCTNLSYRIMRWATPHNLRTMAKLLQECVPVRFEIIHIINAPIVFNLFFTALKPFLKEHIREKIQWHKPPYERLYNHLNIENLPMWVGGTLNIENIKFWYKDFLKDEEILKEDPAMGYKKK